MSAPPPSFSARRRFNCALHAALGMLAVAALVVMANYLAARHSQRLFLSTRSNLRLSPQTLGLLHTLTNQVKATVFYDRNEPNFTTVVGLLREYTNACPRIQMNLVDYKRDQAGAQQVFTTYAIGTNKNLVIFDSNGARWTVPDEALMETQMEVVDAAKREFRVKQVAFYGETAFNLALLGVTSPLLKAYSLTGHGEHDLASAHPQAGYNTFANVLAQYRIVTAPLAFAGTNGVPEDCNLLIVAGPLKPIPDAELDRIEQYLNQGGRLLALFNSFGKPRECGLERILAKWGVAVSTSTNAVTDDKNTTTRGYDLTTTEFAPHPAVRPLYELAQKSPPGQAALHLIRPRAIERLEESLKSADAPAVEALVRSARSASLDGQAGAFPLALAVEKGAVKGVVTQRGTTRMVVAGDSWFLANEMIRSASNRDFAVCAANWLLDRSQLLVGVGPRRMDEFRLTLNRAQTQTLQWLLLGGLPGAVLLFGGLVWLRRRN